MVCKSPQNEVCSAASVGKSVVCHGLSLSDERWSYLALGVEGNHLFLSVSQGSVYFILCE